MNLTKIKDLLALLFRDKAHMKILNKSFQDLIILYQPELIKESNSGFELEFEALQMKMQRAKKMQLEESKIIDLEISNLELIIEENNYDKIFSLSNKPITTLIYKMFDLETLFTYSIIHEENEKIEIHKEIKIIFDNILLNDNETLAKKNFTEEENEKINQQFKDMPILEKAAIILKLYGASNLLYNSILKLAFVVAEIIGLYRYYDRLIKLKNSLIPETEEQKFENSLKKILIGMPKIKERKPNDKYTALTRVQTIIFFKFLQKANYFFKDYSLQSRGNMMLALRALTGFSADTLEKDLGIEKFDDEDIKATQKFLEKLSHLKINKLR